MKRPRILVFGETGQVAWELRRTLSTLGEVVCAGRGSAGCRVDLADADSVRNAIDSVRPQWIVNAAAYTAVDKAEQEPELAMAVNGIAPGIIAEQAKALGCPLIHYSTDYVFDGTAGTPYGADAPTNPQSVYGRSKLAGEQAIAAVDGHHLILRTSWVYGIRGHNFFRTMRRLFAEREELGIVADQVGAPTWSRHIAGATAQLMAVAARDPAIWDEGGGLYHLSSAGQTSWHGFAQAILDGLVQRGESCRTTRLNPITTDQYPLPAPRPAYSVLDNARLEQVFGVQMPAWDEALDQVLDDVFSD